MLYKHLDELNELVTKRLVSERHHRELPLAIYNYTAEAMSLGQEDWPVALQDARGLILDLDGNIVGRPFRKFWNTALGAQEIFSVDAPGLEITEKMDGSLIIVCYYGNERIVASRGSFYSDQARWATSLLNQAWGTSRPALSDTTHLFELIHPNNRIVLDYGQLKTLVHLASIDNNTGSRVTRTLPAVPRVRRYTWEEARRLALDPQGEGKGHEGFVIRYPSGLLVKLKLPEYVRLHRLIFNTSTRTIWEAMKEGADISKYLENTPEDLAEWVHRYASDFRRKFDTHMDRTREYASVFSGMDRKDMAEALKGSIYLHFVAAYVDGKTGIKSLENRIWKFLEPEHAVFFRREAE